GDGALDRAGLAGAGAARFVAQYRGGGGLPDRGVLGGGLDVDGSDFRLGPERGGFAGQHHGRAARGRPGGRARRRGVGGGGGGAGWWWRRWRCPLCCWPEPGCCSAAWWDCRAWTRG